MQELCNDGLRFLVRVDVSDDISNAVKDDEVGFADSDGREYECESVLPSDLPEIEDMEEFFIGFASGHSGDAVAQDFAGCVIALLGVDPDDAQGFVVESFESEDVSLRRSRRHEHGVEIGFSGFGFSGDSDEFGFGKTRSTVPGEEESVGRDLRIGSDPEELQLLDDG